MRIAIQAARLDDCTTEKDSERSGRVVVLSQFQSFDSAEEKERLQKQKDAAKRILPLLKDSSCCCFLCVRSKEAVTGLQPLQPLRPSKPCSKPPEAIEKF